MGKIKTQGKKYLANESRKIFESKSFKDGKSKIPVIEKKNYDIEN